MSLLTLLSAIFSREAFAALWFFVGSSGPFSPTDVAGLVLWLKADAGTFQDTGCSSAATTDTTKVNCWQDQSGEGNHVISSDTANTDPTIETGEQNGNPVIRFGGTSTQRLIAPDDASLDVTTFTAFAVFKVNNDGITDTNAGILLKNGNTSGATAAYGITALKQSAGQSRNGVFMDPTGSAWDQYADGATDRAYSTAWLFTQWYDGSTATCWTNATQDGTENISGAVTTTTGELSIGGVSASFGITSRMRADVAEIILYNSALSQANREAVRDYLNTKYVVY